MLSELEIRNFQSHKKTHMCFTKGVNIITGTSDSGKSAIIRAILWACTNKPNGSAYRSHWGGKTQVALFFDDDKDPMIRVRTDVMNRYRLGSIILDAVGSDVPETIDNYLSLNALNFQRQLDPPFLLSSSDGDVAKHFNKIAELEDIDICFRNMQGDERTLNREINLEKTRIDKLEEDLQEFEFINDFEKNLAYCEMKNDRVDELNKTIDEIRETLTQIQNNTIYIVKHEKIIKQEPLIDHTLQLFNELSTITKMYETLGNELQTLNTIQKEYTKLNSIIKHENTVSSIMDLWSKRTITCSNISILTALINELKETQTDINEEQQRYKKLKYKWKTETPKTCPLCGGELR